MLVLLAKNYGDNGHPLQIQKSSKKNPFPIFAAMLYLSTRKRKYERLAKGYHFSFLRMRAR